MAFGEGQERLPMQLMPDDHVKRMSPEFHESRHFWFLRKPSFSFIVAQEVNHVFWMNLTQSPISPSIMVNHSLKFTRFAVVPSKSVLPAIAPTAS